MDILFTWNTSKIDIIEFRPYMVETAYDYYMTAKESTHKRRVIQNVMSSLVLEILIRTFSTKILGKNDGQYRYIKDQNKKDVHDLMMLYSGLHPSIQEYLFSSDDLEILTIHKDTFKNSRYFYEELQTNNRNTNKLINRSPYSDDIDKLAAKIICKIIHLYRTKDCSDSFINFFNISDFHLKYVRKDLTI